MNCQVEVNKFPKDFIIINEAKAAYCFGIYDKFLNYDNERMIHYIKNVQRGMRAVILYKRRIYCAVCDVHEQKHFDIKRKYYVLSKKFCYDLLNIYGPIIKFIHILFLEYADFLFQFMECYETAPESDMFPFNNFIWKYKRKIPIIRKCFEHLETSEYYRYCWMLCQAY